MMGRDVIVEKMVAFVEDYKRWGGEGNGHIRKTQRPEDIGFIKTEAVIDGLKRYWYTFEPTAYKRGLKEKYPLVIAIHGFSCSGEYFAENSCWHHVGEERGVIVVYPTAYPFDRSESRGRFGTDIAATPSWNSGFIDIETDPAGPDEVSFFKQMIATVEATYPIDTERIYVSGHSNGAKMTQRLVRFWPEKFAGFAPVGGLECRDREIPEPDDGYLRNVWISMGEYDVDGCTLEKGSGSYYTVKNLCAANKIDFKKHRYYESGIYMNTIVRDENGVPLVRFTGIKNWPHTFTPELGFLIYDEFFARFIRRKDGTLEYLA
jgi:predicted peptidase